MQTVQTARPRWPDLFAPLNANVYPAADSQVYEVGHLPEHPCSLHVRIKYVADGKVCRATYFSGKEPPLPFADPDWIQAGTHETISTLFEGLPGLPQFLREALGLSELETQKPVAFDRFKNLLTGAWQSALGLAACGRADGKSVVGRDRASLRGVRRAVYRGRSAARLRPPAPVRQRRGAVPSRLRGRRRAHGPLAARTGAGARRAPVGRP